MTILINRKDYVLNITFGRKLPWSKSLYLITIFKEWYDISGEVYDGKFIKGFFRRKLK